MDKVLHSSNKHDWQTPEKELEVVREFDEIGLDPATAPDNPTKALLFCAPHAPTIWSPRWMGADGLRLSWGLHCDYGIVYCNPPYGREIIKWTAKAREEWWVNDVETVMLLPSRTDTTWYHEANFTAKCEYKGRIKFKGAPHAAPFPSVFLYWGDRIERFREVFSPHGMVLVP